MADVIEESKSNRATCRTCRQKIEKGVLRFGEETENTFSPDGGSSYFWHHLECAAGKVPAKVKQALGVFTGTVPNREKLDAILAAPPKAAAGKGGAKAAFPYAERASTGRSKCMHCDEAIEKGTLRVAVEREVDTGAFTTTGPGYLHPGCAAEYTGDDELIAKIKANMPDLPAADLAELAEAMA
jgi:Poly(ADP-ribose) polymerase and DNA-Ligase Zn-finger region